jgi:hypothetical protein
MKTGPLGACFLSVFKTLTLHLRVDDNLMLNLPVVAEAKIAPGRLVDFVHMTEADRRAACSSDMTPSHKSALRRLANCDLK